ncbi:hypothetical protein QBS70_06125 [Cronobacter sakazakii]|nr:hypothetical protein [Cronobacter sakazakii]
MTTQLADAVARTHDTSDAFRSALSVSCWMGFILLARTLFYDRVAFTVGVLAGLFWPGANAGFAFWAGSVALVTYLLRNLKPFQKNLYLVSRCWRDSLSGLLRGFWHAVIIARVSDFRRRPCRHRDGLDADLQCPSPAHRSIQK